MRRFNNNSPQFYIFENMITILSAEKLAKSKVALIIVLLIAVAFLSGWIVKLSNKNDQWETDYKSQGQRHTAELKVKDSVIYSRDQQIKIISDNSTKAAQLQANEFKGLWLEYVDIKLQAQKKNIIP